MKATVKRKVVKKVIKDVSIEYSVGDIVKSTTTEEFGVVIDAVPQDDTYYIFFFKDGVIVPYNSEYICQHPVYHIPIDDITDIRRCYLDGDGVKSVPLTMNSNE